ncbi:MAG: sulfite exporter TauE/SafE family protein [Bacillota bacterium]
MNILETSLTFLVITLGTIVHGIAGFGVAQVSMGLMPLFRSAASASIIFSLIAVVSNFRVWWSVREEFVVKDWLFPVFGLAFGMPLGIYVFRSFSESQFKIAIGITLILAVILITIFKKLDFFTDWLKEKNFNPGWKSAVTAGFIAGIFGGAVAIPGPPMIIYGTFMMAAGFWKSKHMKAIFTAFFGTLMFYRLISILIAGSFTLPLFLEALVVMPALFLGSWLGIKIYNHISEEIFSWLVIVMLSINAVVLLLTT